MTSTLLRKRKRGRANHVPSFFPGTLMKRRLRKSAFDNLGTFNIDKVTISVQKFWRPEDWPSDIKEKFDIVYKTDSETGVKKQIGTLYFKKYKGREYQVFQSLGRNRNLQFNPRHDFKSLGDFVSFVRELLGDDPYRITRIDYSWLIRKEFVSVRLLWWSIWAKGLQIHKPMPYEKEIFKEVDLGSFHEFILGTKNYLIRVYDCDSVNSNSRRRQKKKVNGCINIEVQIRTEELEKIDVVNLEDMETLNFKKVLDRARFYQPSNVCFKNTKYEHQYQQWEKKGLCKMLRKMYFESKKKNYDYCTSYLSTLEIKDFSFRQGLVKLADKEWLDFTNGCKQKDYKAIRHIAYDLPPPLFPDSQSVVRSCGRHL